MDRIRWSRCAIISVLLLSALSRNANGDDDWRLDEDTKGWIDPHSMLETDPTPIPQREVGRETCEKTDVDCSAIENSLTECSDKMAKLETDLERQKELNRKAETVAGKEQPFFEQYLRHILGLFIKTKDGKNMGYYEADIALPELSYAYLSYYVAKQNVSVQEVHSILLKMITNVRWMKGDDELNDLDAGSYFSFDSGILYYLNAGGAVAVIMVALLQVVSLLRRVRISLSRFVFLVFFAVIFTSFCISVPWTWWHLYKKKVAERMAAMAKRPPDCANEMNSLWKMISSYFRFQTDECQKYYEQLEIDPWWEVPPTQAVAVTFIRFFLEPAKHIGQAIREFMVSAFEGLPIFLWIPVFAFIIILLVLLLFCICGYRISMPFMSIEPGRSDGSRQVAALQDRLQLLQRENEDLRQRLMLPDSRGNAVDERGDGRRTPPQLQENRRRIQNVERCDWEPINRRNEHAAPEAPRTVRNVPPDGACIEKPAAPRPTVDETRPDEKKQVSSTKTSQPSPPRGIPKEETVSEFSTDKSPTNKPPTNNTPTDNTLTDKPPTNNTPTDKPPTNNTPTDNPLTDKPPTDNTPTDKPPTVSDTEPSKELQNADENNEQQTETNGEDLLRSYVRIETMHASEDPDPSENLKREHKASTTDPNTDRVESILEINRNSPT